jgi:hypothetical protein
MFDSKELNDHIKTSSTIKSRAAVIAEWNMNFFENIAEIGNYRYRPTLGIAEKYGTIPNIYDPRDLGNFYTNATEADTLVDGGFEEDGQTPVVFKPKKEKEKLLFSLEECFGKFRPRSGINKLRYGITSKYLHHSNVDMFNRPRYYMPDKNDMFKYWTSYRTENGKEYGIANNTINGNYIIEDTAPYVVYKEEIPINRIVMKMQTNVGNVNLGPFTGPSGIFADPFFGEQNKTTPVNWKVQYLKNNIWIDAISFNKDSLRNNGNQIVGSDGYVEIGYGLIVPEVFRKNFVNNGVIASTSVLPLQEESGQAYLVKENDNDIGTYYIWEGGQYKTFAPQYGWYVVDENIDQLTNFVTDTTSPKKYNTAQAGILDYEEFLFISGIRIVVDTMNKFGSTFDLIELAPRLAVDLTEKTVSYSVTKSASDLGVSGLPVGQLLASTGSLNIFDYDQAFNPNNQWQLDPETNTYVGSVIAKYINKNIQIKFYEIISGVEVKDENDNTITKSFYIPIKTLYSESFPQSNLKTREISLELRDLFFYFESQLAPELLIPNVSLSYAIATIFDSIGFSNYSFKRLDGESDPIIPYLFVSSEKSVAEVLNDLAIATQTAMYFDEYNDFVMMSKDYALPERNQRPTDIVLLGSNPQLAEETFEGLAISGKKELENIIEIASKDNNIYNDGKISYVARYIQKSMGSLKQAYVADKDISWIYKPSLLWEVSGTENIKPTNGQTSTGNKYALAAIPLNSNLTNQIPRVESHELVNNIIDFGDGILFIGRYNGYFYSGGEVIRYDAVEYNVSVLPSSVVDSTFTGGNVWITSAQEYENYFSKLSFNGKIYPTGRVRVYAEPNYETFNGITRMSNGEVAKHGRGQFGTTIIDHAAGLDSHWTNNENVYGCKMKSVYLFGNDSFEGDTGELPEEKLKLEYLVIGGGGGAGVALGQATNTGTGGGGAGGYLTDTDFEPELEKSYVVSIGAFGTNQTNGGRSRFGDIIALGGGGGGYIDSPLGRGGGSGGGAGYHPFGTSQGGVGTVGQGFGGGNRSADTAASAGGGGAGGPGGSGSGNTPGAAGAGLSSSITGVPVTRARGGKGNYSASPLANIASPAPNTGDGGGGGVNNRASSAWGASGVVILRYSNKFSVVVGSGLHSITSDLGAEEKVTTITLGEGNISFTYSPEYFANIAVGSGGDQTGTGLAGVSKSLATQSSRSSVIKNYLSFSHNEETPNKNRLSSTSETVQSSALVFNGPAFSSQESPIDFISYVNKPLNNSFKHFGTRMRIIGKIENNDKSIQTAAGATTYFNIPTTTPDENQTISGGSGGIATLLNPENNNGYYFEIAALSEKNIDQYKARNTNIKKSITRFIAFSPTEAVVYVSSANKKYEVGSKVIITAGKPASANPVNLPTYARGTWKVTAATESTIAIAGSGFTVGDISGINETETILPAPGTFSADGIANIFFYKILKNSSFDIRTQATYDLVGIFDQTTLTAPSNSKLILPDPNGGVGQFIVQEGQRVWLNGQTKTEQNGYYKLTNAGDPSFPIAVTGNNTFTISVPGVLGTTPPYISGAKVKLFKADGSDSPEFVIDQITVNHVAGIGSNLGTNVTTYRTTTNHGFGNGNVVVITGSNPVRYNVPPPSKWVLTKDEDAIPVKLWSGLSSIIVDDGNFAGQSRVVGEELTTVYDLAIEYEDLQKSRRFYLYLNDTQIATVDDLNPLPLNNINNVALFTRGSSHCMFENVYALANRYGESSESEKSPIAKEIFTNKTDISSNEAFRKYSISGIIQPTFLSGVSASEPPKYDIYYEEFGSIFREMAYFNVKYDKAYPALYSTISPTFNKIRGYTVSGFFGGAYGAEFLIFNATDTFLFLDETVGNYLRIQGITFTQDSRYDLTVDGYFEKTTNFANPQIKEDMTILSPVTEKQLYNDIKNSRITYGKNQFSLDSIYIQSSDAANNLMKWLISKIMKPRKSVGVSIFANPAIQLGDIVSIDYSDSSDEIAFEPDKRFVVYSIDYKKDPSGPSMTLYMSEV